MTRELSLQDIRKKFNELGGEEDTANLSAFAVVNQKADQQFLQINLTPASMMYVRGSKIYTNASKLKIKNVRKSRVTQIVDSLTKKEPVKMLINDTPALFIIGLKHHQKHGHVLILDLAIYRESFFYNWQYFIASKIEPSDKEKHSLGKNFRLIEYRQKYDNIFEALDMNQESLVLQAESIIVEKSLAEDEQFCLYDKDNIVAFSKSVSVLLLKGNIVKITGPGWIFFQTSSVHNSTQQRTNSYVKLVLVLAIVMMVLETVLALMI